MKFLRSSRRTRCYPSFAPATPCRGSG